MDKFDVIQFVEGSPNEGQLGFYINDEVAGIINKGGNVQIVEIEDGEIEKLDDGKLKLRPIVEGDELLGEDGPQDSGEESIAEDAEVIPAVAGDEEDTTLAGASDNSNNVGVEPTESGKTGIPEAIATKNTQTKASKPVSKKNSKDTQNSKGAKPVVEVDNADNWS